MDVTFGYRVAPGCCFVCGHSGVDRPVVDLCRDDPGVVRRARVYLCGECVMAAARKVCGEMGLVVVSGRKGESMVGVRRRARELEEGVGRVVELLGELRAVVDGLVE